MHRFLVAAAVGMVFLSTPRASAQVLGPNLLQNPHFDHDLGSWQFASYFQWLPADADDLPSSGSALLFAPPTSASYTSQCVDVVGGVRYRFGAKLRTGASPGTSTWPLVLTFYPLPGCGGMALASDYVSVSVDSSVTWTHGSKTLLAPAGTVSAAVSASLFCGMARFCPGVALQFDDAFLRAEGPVVAADFHTLSPCRLTDTRSGSMVKGFRQFSVATLGCGVPATARAVSLNVTVTGATAEGNLRLFPADADVPSASAANFVPGQTRANNVVVALCADAALEVYSEFAAPGASVEVILDVNGYFE